MDPGAPSPLDDALAHLGGLAAAGAAPERVTRVVGEVVAGWAAEADMDAATARTRIERLWDSLGNDAAGLEEQINDAAAGADTHALAQARRVLAALQAAVAALAAAHERL